MKQNTKVNPSELLKLYESFHPKETFSPEDVIQWGQAHGYDPTPEFDPNAAAIKLIKRAIKNSTFIDPQGRKIPKYISVGSDEESLALWSELAITPNNVVQNTVNKNRKKAIQTLVQQQLITDSYNDNFNISSIPVQLDLFVEDEVKEELIMKRNRSGKKSNTDIFNADDDGDYA